jgi:hypothetical protein
MKTLATRCLSKAHKNMMCRILYDEARVLHYCQFSITGRERAVHFTISFPSVQEASGYLDRCTHADFTAIVNFLISQAVK